MKKGTRLNGKNFKVHLDGYNLMPFLKGEVKESPREGVPLLERRRRPDGDPRRQTGRSRSWSSTPRSAPRRPSGVWQGQFTKLRAPKLYNLRADPFERGTESIYYGDWMAHRMFLLVPAQAIVAKWLESFKEFPPRAKPASFTVSDAMEKIAPQVQVRMTGDRIRPGLDLLRTTEAAKRIELTGLGAPAGSGPGVQVPVPGAPRLVALRSGSSSNSARGGGLNMSKLGLRSALLVAVPTADGCSLSPRSPPPAPVQARRRTSRPSRHWPGCRPAICRARALPDSLALAPTAR